MKKYIFTRIFVFIAGNQLTVQWFHIYLHNKTEGKIKERLLKLYLF